MPIFWSILLRRPAATYFEYVGGILSPKDLNEVYTSVADLLLYPMVLNVQMWLILPSPRLRAIPIAEHASLWMGTEISNPRSFAMLCMPRPVEAPFEIPWSSLSLLLRQRVDCVTE